MGFLKVNQMHMSSEMLFTTLERLNARGQVMSAVINADVTDKTEAELTDAGLEADHAFTVLEVVALQSHRLVQHRPLPKYLESRRRLTLDRSLTRHSKLRRRLRLNLNHD